ncbi:MAG: DUF4403 family protein [Cyclobacteriaceae bacterium]
MKKKIQFSPQHLIIISLVMLFSCSDSRQSSEYTEPLKLPPSFVSFNIDFPIVEMEDGVNTMLKDVLIDDVIKLNKKGDQLFLKVVRNGHLDLALRGNRVYASLPLDVKVAIKKKVMGVTFSNEDVPVSFSGVMQAKANATLDSLWNFTLLCEEMNMDWVSEPSINILGMEIDLSKTMEKALDQNEEKILSELCRAVNSSIDFRTALLKVWGDIQRPIRIAKKPVYAWLYTIPDALNAELLPLKKDTLKIHVEYRSSIYITTDKQITSEITSLPTRGKPINSKSAILAYVQADVPIAKMEELASNLLVGKTYSYEGYSATIEKIKMSSQTPNILTRVTLSGDLNGDVLVTGRPSFTKKMELTIDDFQYEIDSEDQVAQATDWLTHSMIESYISKMLTVDASSFFNNLDSLANAGIAKSRVKDKISATFDFKDIKPYQQQIQNDTLRWVFYIEGSAGLTLKKDVFKKGSR